jgi:hypothetical protein
MRLSLSLSPLLLVVLSCLQSRTDNVIEVPAGFRGWAAVEFERPDCSPLTKHGNAWHVAIPPTGYLCTSNPLEEGWANDTFTEQGRGSTSLAQAGPSDPDDAHAEVRVRGFVVGISTAIQSGEPTRHWWHFCVGSKAECPYQEVELPPLPSRSAG